MDLWVCLNLEGFGANGLLWASYCLSLPFIILSAIYFICYIFNLSLYLICLYIKAAIYFICIYISPISIYIVIAFPSSNADSTWINKRFTNKSLTLSENPESSANLRLWNMREPPNKKKHYHFTVWNWKSSTPPSRALWWNAAASRFTSGA